MDSKYEKFREQAVILSRLRALHNEKSSEIEVMRDTNPKTMQQEGLFFRDKIARSLINPPIYNHTSPNRVMTQYHLFSKYQTLQKDYKKETALGHLLSKKTRVKILHIFHKFKSFFEQQLDALQSDTGATLPRRESITIPPQSMTSIPSKKSEIIGSMKKIDTENCDYEENEMSDRDQEVKFSSARRIDTSRSRKSTFIMNKLGSDS